jgi:hypothetical protein
MILNCKTMPVGQLLSGIVDRGQMEGWVTNKHVKDWLAVVWNRVPGVLLGQWGGCCLMHLMGV